MPMLMTKKRRVAAKGHVGHPKYAKFFECPLGCLYQIENLFVDAV